MDIEPRIFKYTVKNIEMFEDICNKSANGEINNEEKDFVMYFELRLAESILKDYGESAVKIARHIFASRDLEAFPYVLSGFEKWNPGVPYCGYSPTEEYKRRIIEKVQTSISDMDCTTKLLDEATKMNPSYSECLKKNPQQ